VKLVGKPDAGNRLVRFENVSKRSRLFLSESFRKGSCGTHRRRLLTDAKQVVAASQDLQSHLLPIAIDAFAVPKAESCGIRNAAYLRE
jgi:hypothetical protein